MYVAEGDGILPTYRTKVLKDGLLNRITISHEGLGNEDSSHIHVYCNILFYLQAKTDNNFDQNSIVFLLNILHQDLFKFTNSKKKYVWHGRFYYRGKHNKSTYLKRRIVRSFEQ